MEHLEALAPTEEEQILSMYRKLAKWDQFAVFVILTGMSFGSLTERTDRYSGAKIRDILGMSK
jgi:hypothetical protein